MKNDVIDLTSAELIEEAFKGGGGRSGGEGSGVKGQAASRLRFIVGRSSSLRSRLGAVSGRPEAVVKNIRRGGVNSGKELCRQITYLTKREYGVVDIRENGMKVLNAGEIEETIDEWHQGFKGKTNFGYTRHMVVSFPEGTYPEAAHQAGLDFAHEVFGSAQFGDCWDYLTVFHDDTENTHVHLVVNCRGVEEGHWLKMSMRDEMNIDRIRQILVEVSEPYGIDLTATTRVERGLVQSVSDETYLAQRGESVIEDVAGIETLAKAAAVQVVARDYEKFADTFAQFSEVVSAQIRAVSEQLIEGEVAVISQNANLFREADSLAVDIYGRTGDVAPQAFVDELVERARGGQGAITLDEQFQGQIDNFIAQYSRDESCRPFVSSLSDLAGRDEFQSSPGYLDRAARVRSGVEASVDALRFEVVDQNAAEMAITITEMEDIAKQVEDSGLRTSMEVEIGAVKGQLSGIMPFDADLYAFSIKSSDYGVGISGGDVSGFEGTDAEKWENVRASIMERAEGSGIDGDLFLERYLSHDMVSVGTASDWRSAEVREVMDEPSFEGSRDQARSVVEEIHQFAAQQFAELVESLQHSRDGHELSETGVEAPTHSRDDDDGHSL